MMMRGMLCCCVCLMRCMFEFIMSDELVMMSVEFDCRRDFVVWNCFWGMYFLKNMMFGFSILLYMV